MQGTVCANYRVIGSQWAAHPSNGPKKDTVAVPNILANTTLETYIQNSSCLMTCHQYAKTTARINANYSFLLGLAK